MNGVFTYQEYLKNKFQYQEDGEILLLEKKHACLYYEPGKGKTYPAIYALLQVTNDEDNVLILSTADSVKNMWNIDIVPQKILPKKTLIMSFTKAIQDSSKELLYKTKWKAIIIDECHKIKSNGAQISKVVHKITKNTPYVFGLTGTPRGNVDLDIFCQFHNLNISEWGQISYSQFVNQCCDVQKKYGPYGAYNDVIGINKKYIPGWERNIAMYTQRVTYEDGDMPPLDIQKVNIKFNETKEYKHLKKGIFEIEDEATTLTKLAAITKMHQCANGFLYYDENGVTKTIDINFNQKINWIKANVHIDEPTTIVYRFKADLEQLTKHFANWTESISDFKQGKSNLLFLQCSRCESFNLQMCKRMIFYTMDYSFIKFKQMLHRVWRTGQDDSTLIQILIFEGSIEEEIYKAVMSKKSLHELFMSIKGAQ